MKSDFRLMLIYLILIWLSMDLNIAVRLKR